MRLDHSASSDIRLGHPILWENDRLNYLATRGLGSMSKIPESLVPRRGARVWEFRAAKFYSKDDLVSS